MPGTAVGVAPGTTRRASRMHTHLSISPSGNMFDATPYVRHAISLQDSQDACQCEAKAKKRMAKRVEISKHLTWLEPIAITASISSALFVLTSLRCALKLSLRSRRASFKDRLSIVRPGVSSFLAGLPGCCSNARETEREKSKNQG